MSQKAKVVGRFVLNGITLLIKEGKGIGIEVSCENYKKGIRINKDDIKVFNHS